MPFVGSQVLLDGGVLEDVEDTEARKHIHAAETERVGAVGKRVLKRHPRNTGLLELSNASRGTFHVAQTIVLRGAIRPADPYCFDGS